MLPLAAVRLLVEAMQAAPIIEIFTRMACQVHRPDLGIGYVGYPDWRDDPLPAPAGVSPLYNSTQPPTRGELCAQDPDVQRAVATIITGSRAIPLCAWYVSYVCAQCWGHWPES